MNENNEISFMNSFGILSKEGFILIEFNKKIVFNYKEIKKIQLLKKRETKINRYTLFIAVVLLILGFVCFFNQYDWVSYLLLFASFSMVLVSFFYKKYNYYFVLIQNKNKIKFKVDFDNKENAKVIVEKVLDIIKINY